MHDTVNAKAGHFVVSERLICESGGGWGRHAGLLSLSLCVTTHKGPPSAL